MKLTFQTLAKFNLRYKGFLTFYLIAAFIISVVNVFMMRLIGDMGQAAVNMDMNASSDFLALLLY